MFTILYADDTCVLLRGTDLSKLIIYSLLSVRLELPVADSIKHHVYSVRTIRIFPSVII